jgi:hypothetical protein
VADECNKCHEKLYDCPDCNGQSNKSFLGSTLTCSTCRSTGSLCPNHGGHWE